MNKKGSLYPVGLRHPSALSEDLESQLTTIIQQRNLLLANTYKTEPDSIFREVKVKKKIDEILSKTVGDMPYNAERCKTLCIELASEIKDQVKSLGFKRHRLVSHITISSSHGQGLRHASRAVWDENNDRYVSCVYRNASMNVVAVLYAVYLE